MVECTADTAVMSAVAMEGSDMMPSSAHSRGREWSSQDPREAVHNTRCI